MAPEAGAIVVVDAHVAAVGAKSVAAASAGVLYRIEIVAGVLIVGDGDFSFSRALCQIRVERGAAGHLVCTSLDSAAQARGKYARAPAHLGAIERLAKGAPGAVVVRHGIDATKLAVTFHTRFDRIVFNFPHTGKQRVHLNRAMLGEFFFNAEAVLAPGGVVLVTLKDRPPYSRWDLDALAQMGGFVHKATVLFVQDEFAGYAHQTTDPDAVALRLTPCATNTYVFGRP